ncbi:MAG TPA: MBL fold metallo-hydrolase [Thermoleophilaceae bacterium]|nr:MBL fold metallo-hydrolase [Thermoleophilaceae bacterium]
MRAVAVHPDAVVVTSRLWQTTATAIRARGTGPAAHETDSEAASGEAVLIDSPYFPDELELLPALLDQAGFRIDGLLATHADFDHLLGRLAFGDRTLGVGEPTAARLRAEPGAAQRELRDADAEHYVTRPRPLALGGVQALPVPGRVELGGEELELHSAEGHTADGTAVFARSLGVLVCGDYLSDVEIPWISSGGSLDAYRATLARLTPLVRAADAVVPGHGSPHDRDTALRILDEDLGYLQALGRGEERPALPGGRDTRRQRAIHTENLERLR